MKLFAYTDTLKKQLGSKTQPMPWLHCAILKLDQTRLSFAIYVWDTRDVLESKVLSKKYDGIIGKSVSDSREMIKGGDKEATELINESF